LDGSEAIAGSQINAVVLQRCPRLLHRGRTSRARPIDALYNYLATVRQHEIKQCCSPNEEPSTLPYGTDVT
jgi:hypothetical protein